MTVEALSPLFSNPPTYRQALMPNHLSGSFVGDDEDNHDFVFQSRGKQAVQVALDNAPNAEITWSLYGMHSKSGAVGDAGVFEVDVSNALAAATKVAVLNTSQFPFYLLRCVYAAAPTDTPKKTVSVFINSVS
jgi:hypothetical protein